MRFRATEWHLSLPSTNQYLRQRLAENPELDSGTVVAAREQTAGCGQRGRAWFTAPDRDLAFSFLLRSRVDLAWIPSLPMSCALAVTEVLHEQGLPAKVKWPNDVLVGGRKICGILVEHLPCANDAQLIVGIGLNINSRADELGGFERPATSMLAESGKTHQVGGILEQLLQRLDLWIGRWEHGGFPAIREDWIAAAVGLGKPATISQPCRSFEGVLESFGEYGEIILRQPDGHRRLVWSGQLHASS